MRKFLTICAILLSVGASAQWQLTGSKVRYVNGIGIPTKDTAAGVSADSSQILIRPADSSLYVKYKRTWQKVGSGGGGIGGSGTTNYIPKFTSSSAIGNSQIFDDGTNVGIGTTSPAAKFNVTGGEFRIDGASGSGAIATFYSTTTNADARTWGIYSASQVFGDFDIRQSNAKDGDPLLAGTSRLYLSRLGNVGIGYTTPATRLAVNGTALINTNTDNGVDALQVSGSMNVSAKATAQTLSATSNASVGGTFNVSGISTFSSRINAVVGGIRLGAAGASESLSVFLGGSTDAYPLVNNAYVTPGVGWKYLGNGPASIISYESGDLIYYNCPTNSSGADAVLGTITHRMRITAAGNMGFGTYTAPAARLAVDGTALININTDNGVDKLQVNGSISGIGFKQAYVTKTGAYTATNDDYVIDCTSGTFTVTLPASSGRTGRILIIKNSGAGTITVDGNASETIDGATTYSLSVQYATVQIMSDGTNWKIISKF